MLDKQLSATEIDRRGVGVGWWGVVGWDVRQTTVSNRDR